MASEISDFSNLHVNDNNLSNKNYNGLSNRNSRISLTSAPPTYFSENNKSSKKKKFSSLSSSEHNKSCRSFSNASYYSYCIKGNFFN